MDFYENKNEFDLKQNFSCRCCKFLVKQKDFDTLCCEISSTDIGVKIGHASSSLLSKSNDNLLYLSSWD